MSLTKDLDRLNEQQAKIIKEFYRPSLIIAGPGTGKTRTIAILIGNLLRRGVRLKEILALTFSKKAANELRERVLEYFPHSFDQCWISTFHSFCARILREQYYRILVRPDFKLLTSFKEALLMSAICSKQDVQAFVEFGKVLQKRGFQQEILTFISLLKSNLVSFDDFCEIIEEQSKLSIRTKNRLKEIASLYHFYENECKKCGYLDFRDLISLTIKLLQIPEVAAIYREKFKVILVDEFQDTDPAQYLLLKLLCGKNEKAQIAVIGDPHQSIYRFRGADPNMMSKTGPFKKDFKARIFSLTLNYRSSRTIVNIASRLAWKNKDKDNLQLEAQSKETGFVQLFNARDELEEAKFLARKIAALLIYGEKRIYKPEDIAILVRNNYQIDLITENLQALHIPFEIAGDMKFFRSEEVIVLASLLKIAALSGQDKEAAIQRAFVSPLFKIDPLWAQAIVAQINPSKPITWFLEKISAQDFSQLPETSEENILRAQYFAEIIQLIQKSSRQPLNAVFARLLLALPDLIADPSSAEAKNALHFRNMIADYIELFQRQHNREALVSDLIESLDEWLTYYASTLEQEQSIGSNGVKIMTVHQSKGLEFPVVAVPGLVEGQFPVKFRENLLITTATIENFKKSFNSRCRPVKFFNPYPTSHQEHIEEERRLFFVALTRAKEGLLLSFPLKIGTEPAIPAPYLKEIGLKPTSEEIESRPLNLSEFRTKLALLGKEKLQQLEPQIKLYEDIIRDENSIYGVRPRQFINAEPNEVSLPQNFVFSATSLKNYLDCPRRFFFLDVLKIKDPLQAKKSLFQTGNAFHAILEELHRPGSIWEQGKYPDTDDQDKLVQEKALPFLCELDFFRRYQEIESIKKAFSNYVNAVYQNFQLPPRNTKGVEFAFSFTFNGYQFKGRFDRLIETKEGLLVVDYKTTKQSPMSSAQIYEQAFPENGLPVEIQMPLYLLACRQLFKNKKASVIMFYLCHDLYRRKTGNMLPGFMRAGALNLGCGPEFGINVSENVFTRFEEQMCKLLDEIRENHKFDCRPSSHPNARSCLRLDQQRKPKCEFVAFCQERLEQLRYVSYSNE